MINKSAHLIFFALILLSLSACQPQVDLEPAQPLATPDSPLATPPSPLATPDSPLATPDSPLPTEELIMPIDPTAQPPNPTEEEPADPPAAQQPSQPPAEPIFQPGVQSWVDQAKEDLAQRLNISTAEIELLSFESKVWPNGALGCPKPGMNYIQVLVEGYLIRLRAGKEVYNYHGGEGRPPFLCRQPLQGVKPLPVETLNELVPPPRLDE